MILGNMRGELSMVENQNNNQRPRKNSNAKIITTAAIVGVVGGLDRRWRFILCS